MIWSTSTQLLSWMMKSRKVLLWLIWQEDLLKLRMTFSSQKTVWNCIVTTPIVLEMNRVGWLFRWRYLGSINDCWLTTEQNRIKSFTWHIKYICNKETHMYIVYIYIDIYIYTGCPRRNVPDFEKVFLVSEYTDITQNTYIESWTVTEIMAREKCGLLAVPRTAPFQLTRYVYTAHFLETGMQSTLCLIAHV